MNNINIIGISGRISSGKDTVGNIIQYLTSKHKAGYTYPSSEQTFNEFNRFGHRIKSDWEIKKFADKLKDIVCLLIGCTREQLESQEFKSSPLGNEWIRYGYADGFQHIYKGDIKITQMINKECSKERYEEEYRINWQTAYKHEFTPRELMQLIGTDLFRDKLLNNIWVNALFADYKRQTHKLKYRNQDIEVVYNSVFDKNDKHLYPYPNWIVTDVRFPNELEAIKERNGIVIRINRDSPIFYKYSDNEVKNKLNEMGFKDLSNGTWEELAINEGFTYSKSLNKWEFDEDNIVEHESEIALDDYNDFDYIIDNSGTIEDLIKQVERILKAEFIL